jgi:hypothetical protein
MNKHISALFALIMGALLMTSCLKSDDSSDIIYYNDTAITAFSLSTVNRYIHTTSKSGKDYVYKKVLANPVTFYIDHYNKTIYNADSLYADCDLQHVLASISTQSNGVIAIKSMISDTLRTYSSTDSLDFSKPREIRVYANDGSTYRAYQVIVNKHQAVTGKLLWEQMPAGSYPVDEEKLRWEQLVAEKGLARFIGAGTKEAYAYNQVGELMVSTDEGDTWTVDEIDDAVSLLPKESVAFVSCPFAANSQTDYQILAGVSQEGEIASCVWRKVAEYGEGSETGKWALLPVESYNNYYLPATGELSLVWFHRQVLAITGSWIRSSKDGGITWKTSDDLQLPADDLISVEACTDEQGALWLKDKNSDLVWRGILVEE